MAFKALLNAKARPFPSLCSSFICAYCSTERAPTKKLLRVLSIIDQLRAWAHRRSAYTQLSPLYPSLYPYVTHVINYSRPSPAFPYWKRRKAGRGLGTRLFLTRVAKITKITVQPRLPNMEVVSAHLSQCN